MYYNTFKGGEIVSSMTSWVMAGSSTSATEATASGLEKPVSDTWIVDKKNVEVVTRDPLSW